MNTLWLTRRDFVRQLHLHWPTLVVLTFASATAGGLIGLMTNPTSDSFFKTGMTLFVWMTALASGMVLWNIWKVSVDLRRSYCDTLVTMGYGPRGIAWMLAIEGAAVGLIAGVVGALCSPIVYQAFLATFRASKVPDLPTGQPDWIGGAGYVVALAIVISILAAVSSTRSVTSDKKRKTKNSVVGKRTVVSLAVSAVVALGFALLGLSSSALQLSTFQFACAATLITPGIVLLVHKLAHRAGKAAGYRPFVVLATSREFLHSSTKLSFVLTAFASLFIVLVSIVGTMDQASRQNMSSYFKDAHTVVRTDGDVLSGADAQRVCSAGADCEHLVLTSVKGRNSGEGIATEETWSKFFQPGGTLAKLPGAGEKVKVAAGKVTANSYDYFVAVPSADLRLDQAKRARLLSHQPFSNLPDGFESVPVREFIATMNSEESIRGSGVSSLLPFFSTIFVVLASFAFGTRYLRVAALAQDNNAALRQGITMKTLMAAEVVSAVTIAVSVCLSVGLAAQLGRMRTSEIVRESGVNGFVANFPTGYLLATFVCVVLALITAAPLALRMTTARV